MHATCSGYFILDLMILILVKLLNYAIYPILSVISSLLRPTFFLSILL